MLVAYCRLCYHCHNLAEGGCLLSRFHFTSCHYFLGHVTCWNLPWQGLHEEFIVKDSLAIDCLQPAGFFLLVVSIMVHCWLGSAVHCQHRGATPPPPPTYTHTHTHTQEERKRENPGEEVDK